MITFESPATELQIVWIKELQSYILKFSNQFIHVPTPLTKSEAAVAVRMLLQRKNEIRINLEITQQQPQPRPLNTINGEAKHGMPTMR